LLTSATTDTDNGGSLSLVAAGGAHIGKGTAVIIGLIAVIPAVVVPVVVTHGRGKQAPTQPTCVTNPYSSQCG
jgi:hypothetical protein